MEYTSKYNMNNIYVLRESMYYVTSLRRFDFDFGIYSGDYISNGDYSGMLESL